jgi:hypothetical protein
MIVVFGGRGCNNETLNDSWELRRQRNGKWDWMRAPEKNTPSGRYQHTSLFVGSLMLIIGGKTNNLAETLPL